MILKKANSKKRNFKGVDFELLANGQKSMITKMIYKDNDKVPVHNHPNEQAGYVVSGIIRLKIDGDAQVLTAGDSYIIPENISHSVEVIEAGETIDIFTPPRKDYL